MLQTETVEGTTLELLEVWNRGKYCWHSALLEEQPLPCIWNTESLRKSTIEKVKIDCIPHSYDLLEKPCLEKSIRIYSMEDIITMKLSTIADNGYRLKDFIDIAFFMHVFLFIPC